MGWQYGYGEIADTNFSMEGDAETGYNAGSNPFDDQQGSEASQQGGTNWTQQQVENYMKGIFDQWASAYTPPQTDTGATDFTYPTGAETWADIQKLPEYQQMSSWFQGGGGGANWATLPADQQEAAFQNVWSNSMTDDDRKALIKWYADNQPKFQGDITALTQAYNAEKQKYMQKYSGVDVTKGWENIANIAQGIPGAMQPYMSATQGIADYMTGAGITGTTTGTGGTSSLDFTSMTPGQQKATFDDAYQNLGDTGKQDYIKWHNAQRAKVDSGEISQQEFDKLTAKKQGEIIQGAGTGTGTTTTGQGKQPPANYTTTKEGKIFDLDTGKVVGNASEFNLTGKPATTTTTSTTTPTTGNLLQDTMNSISDLAQKAGLDMPQIADINAITKNLQNKPAEYDKLQSIAAKLEGGTATNKDMQILQTMITDMETAGSEAMGSMANIAKNLENSTPALDKLANQIDELSTAGMDSQDKQVKIADLLAGQGTEELQTLKDQIAGLADIGMVEATELKGFAKDLMNLPSQTIEDLKKIANSVLTADPETEEGQKLIAQALGNITDAQSLVKQREVATGMSGLAGPDSMIAQQKAALAGLTPTQAGFQQQVTPMINDMLKQMGRSGYGSSSMADQAISGTLGSQWQQYQLPRQQAALQAMQNIQGQELGLSQAQMGAWGNISEQERLRQMGAAGILGNVDAQSLARQQAGMAGLQGASAAELARQMGGAGVLAGQQGFDLQKGMAGIDAAALAQQARAQELGMSGDIYGQQTMQDIQRQQAQAAAQAGMVGQQTARQLGAADIYGQTGQMDMNRQAQLAASQANLANLGLQGMESAGNIYAQQMAQETARQVAAMQGLQSSGNLGLNQMTSQGNILGQLGGLDVQRQQTAMNAYQNMANQVLAQQQAMGNIYGNLTGQQIGAYGNMIGGMGGMMGQFQAPYNQMGNWTWGG